MVHACRSSSEGKGRSSTEGWRPASNGDGTCLSKTTGKAWVTKKKIISKKKMEALHLNFILGSGGDSSDSECLLHKDEDLNSESQYPCKSRTCVCRSTARELDEGRAETEGS